MGLRKRIKKENLESVVLPAPASENEEGTVTFTVFFYCPNSS
jgi:hypothetical protein